MDDLWGWAIYAWVGLPTVMYGGYALLGLLKKPYGLIPFQRTWFRAGHAHAGVFLVAFLAFLEAIARTDLAVGVKHLSCAIFMVGILGQSGGFFVHMSWGEEGASSIGTTITTVGAALLTLAIAMLVYGIATTG